MMGKPYSGYKYKCFRDYCANLLFVRNHVPEDVLQSSRGLAKCIRFLSRKASAHVFVPWVKKTAIVSVLLCKLCCVGQAVSVTNTADDSKKFLQSYTSFRIIKKTFCKSIRCLAYNKKLCFFKKTMCFPKKASANV